MTRRTYVYDHLLRRLVERPVKSQGFSGAVFGDLPDFVSPVDGKVVKGRRGLREHNRRHDVTNSADYSPEYLKNRRAETARQESRELTRDMVRAYDELSRRK